jgi:hypothetical protein
MLAGFSRQSAISAPGRTAGLWVWAALDRGSVVGSLGVLAVRLVLPRVPRLLVLGRLVRAVPSVLMRHLLSARRLGDARIYVRYFLEFITEEGLAHAPSGS